MEVRWTKEDFEVFSIDGLDARMQALTTHIRPKFQQLGDYFSTYFSAATGDEFFPHVAKHARRTVNPPRDSWVAFAPYKRGYKALPHFQIGLWGTHLFIIVAVIYEVPQKAEIAARLLQNKQLFEQLPAHFILSGDHMSPSAAPVEKETLQQLLERLQHVKKAEFLVGRHIPAQQAASMSSEEFLKVTEETFEALLPIYKTMIGQ